MARVYSIVAILLLVGLASSANIVVKNNRLYVNCEEFFIKSACYSPTPLGRSDPDSQFVGGLCSPRKNVFGVEESACLDEDMFDGSNGDPDRNPAGPQNGWFRALWERDFPVMKELGVNTIRIYHVSPFTRQASIEQLGTNGIQFPIGKSHREFLDLAGAYGLKVIFPLPGEEAYLRSKTHEEMFQMIRNVVDEVGNHSSIIMWALGNELPLDDQLIGLLNDYMDYARNYTMERWNRFIPCTHAVVDLPPSYDKLARELRVDIFSTNAGYRGFGFSDLWDGNPAQGFSGWRNLSKQYNKPVFISEVGWHTLNNSISKEVPNWFNQIYKNLMPHVDDGCVGMAFFEFNDERTKVDDLQKTMGIVAFEENIIDGKSSADINVWHVDKLVRKENIFDAVKSGEIDGIPYNFNADVFTLIGRPQDALPAGECVAVPDPTYSVTTGAGTTDIGTTGSTVPSTTTGVATTGVASTTGEPQNPVSTTGTTPDENLESSASSVIVNVFILAICLFAML